MEGVEKNDAGQPKHYFEIGSCDARFTNWISNRPAPVDLGLFISQSPTVSVETLFKR
jgi:hypothetical protein